MGPLLYSIVRMTRPEHVVEFGSGYTTLFVLKALAENVADIEVERELLHEKTAALGDLSNVTFTKDVHRDPVFAEWLFTDDRASAVDPAFYLKPYRPRLYAFEKRAPDHDYARAMRDVVLELGFEHLFEHICGTTFAAGALPADAAPIDLAWNDDHGYREFFSEFWPALSPHGGMFVFHNVPAVREWWSAIAWMKDQRAEANDLEALVLHEPHKLNQNGCAILRRTSEYKPPFAMENPQEILPHLREFMARRR